MRARTAHAGLRDRSLVRRGLAGGRSTLAGTRRAGFRSRRPSNGPHRRRLRGILGPPQVSLRRLSRPLAGAGARGLPRVVAGRYGVVFPRGLDRLEQRLPVVPQDGLVDAVSPARKTGHLGYPVVVKAILQLIEQVALKH